MYQQESIKGKRVNPPYSPYFQANPSQVLVLHMVSSPSAVNVTTRVAQVFSQRMKMCAKPLGLYMST